MPKPSQWLPPTLLDHPAFWNSVLLHTPAFLTRSICVIPYILLWQFNSHTVGFLFCCSHIPCFIPIISIFRKFCSFYGWLQVTHQHILWYVRFCLYFLLRTLLQPNSNLGLCIPFLFDKQFTWSRHQFQMCSSLKKCYLKIVIPFTDCLIYITKMQWKMCGECNKENLDVPLHQLPIKLCYFTLTLLQLKAFSKISPILNFFFIFSCFIV